MEETQLDLESAAEDEAVLSIYRQIVAVLGRDAGSVIADPVMVEVADTLFGAFAEAGVEGLTFEQARHACRHFPEKIFTQRFTVLKELGAIQPMFPRPNARHFRASFTTYVSLLFLRRMMARGGQSELHQLLAMEQLSLTSESATESDGRAAASRLTHVFRFIASELSSLVVADDDERLREKAVLLWDAHALKAQADNVHRVILDRWPNLARPCAELRAAIRAYGDATQSACARLQASAGTTRALGMLPPRAWTTFVKHRTVSELSNVLTSFVFDAPAPWIEPAQMREALERLARPTTERRSPPRSSTTDTPPSEPADERTMRDREALREVAEEVLDGQDRFAVHELLRECSDWPTARRMLAELTAVANDSDLPYQLSWKEHLDVDVAATPAWVTTGWFGRTLTDTGDNVHD